MNALKVGLVLLLVVYAAMNLYMYANQRQLMYFPVVERMTPAQAGLKNVQEVTLRTDVGHELVSWHGWRQIRDAPMTKNLSHTLVTV